MEAISSASNHVSPSSTTLTTTAIPPKQPTYTTAGTIYNPEATQPLQPPARRGRSFKWNPGGGIYSSLALLPKSVLATLPLSPGSGGRGQTVLTYTPLQQNYDRAVSPAYEADHFPIDMDTNAPWQRCNDSNNGSNQDSVTRLDMNVDQYHSDGDADDSDDGKEDTTDDSELGMDPLLNMTVKSLHNLASYPNPNQKKAQKALLRGAKPHLNGPSLSSTSTLGGGSFTRMEVLETTEDRQRESCLLAAEGDRPRSASQLFKNLMNKGLSVGNGETCPLGPGALATGPGAPLPLTAGPPGQRQYRPSTFESTFKALHPRVDGIQTKVDGCRRSSDDGDALSAARQALRRAGIEDLSASSEVPPWFLRRTHSLSPLAPSFVSQPGAARVCSGPPGLRTMSKIPPYKMVLQGGGRETIEQQPSEASRVGTMSDPFEEKPAPLRHYRLPDEAIKAREERLNKQWYAGLKVFKIPDGDAATDTQTATECAKPLLEMALTTLSQTIERREGGNALWQFETPAASLCDWT